VEVIGRHAGDGRGPAVRVETEELGLPPDLDTVQVDVEWQVAEEQHAAIVRVTLERGPLQREQILLEERRAKGLLVPGQELPHGRRARPLKLLRPMPPRRAAEALREDAEHAVRQKPAAPRTHESREHALPRA